MLVRSTTPEEAAKAEATEPNCDRCGASRDADLRLLRFHGLTRYAERTVCDTCAEELLELFLDSPPQSDPE